MQSTQATDFYKLSHEKFMNKGTTLLYSNFTPRSNKHATVPMDHVVVFAVQYFIKDYLIREWNETFFDLPKKYAISRLNRRIKNSIGDMDISHFEKLHDLGYLPLCIEALPEGTLCPIGVPLLMVYNTHEDYAWLTNYIETVLSCDIWKPITTATIAKAYRNMMEEFADKTCENQDHISTQCHGFEFRGMSGRHDAAISAMGHLLSFVGTDTIPAIEAAEEYYNANSDKELVGCSVPASEHSVTSLGSSVDGEFETIKRWITEDYPSGIVSVVSDTYDYWKVLTEYLPRLKAEILARTENNIGLSKVVVRPDSGDPYKIICGDPEAEGPAKKGSIELLWESFGGHVNEKGYRELDPHIGLIYGDSITYDLARRILTELESQGFASSNVVFGIGSYTYQMITRDTFGFAMKATAAIVDGVEHQIFKDPITDDGTKKSARGFLNVSRDLKLTDGLSREQSLEMDSAMHTVFIDGKMVNETSLAEVRDRLEITP